MYVGDVAAAFDKILHAGVDGEVYNIGCHEEFTNLEVAERLVKAIRPDCKDPTEQITFVEDRPVRTSRWPATTLMCQWA